MAIPGAPTATLPKVSAALLLIVPFVALVLAAISFTRWAVHGRGRIWARYAMIAALTGTSALVGVLALSSNAVQEPGSARDKVSRSLQALLGFLVGLSVLDLCRPSGDDGTMKLRARRVFSLYASGLSIMLCGATLISLITPFLGGPNPAQSASPIPAYFAPALFLAFTALALPRVILRLCAHRPVSGAPTIAHPTLAFPEIQSRGASPAFHADFGFDPAAGGSSAGAQPSPATLRTFRFPPLPTTPATAAARAVPSSFRSFLPPPSVPAHQQQPQQARLPPIPATPSNASSTSTSTITRTSNQSHTRSRSNSNSPGTPARDSSAWLGSLSSLRSQVSLGALRAKEVLGGGAGVGPGTTRRPITIHVATQRTSFTHAREVGGHEASVGVGDCPAEAEAGKLDIDDSAIDMGYPPRQQQFDYKYDYDYDYGWNTQQQQQCHGHEFTLSRASEASTSQGHAMLEVKAAASRISLGVPSPLTPIESDVEQQYRTREHYFHRDWDADAKPQDMNLALEQDSAVDIDMESTDGGCHAFNKRRGSLSVPGAVVGQTKLKGVPCIDIALDHGVGQRVTRVALPMIGFRANGTANANANLGSRFSIGDDGVSFRGAGEAGGKWTWAGITERSTAACIFAAQAMSGAGWGLALAAALVTAPGLRMDLGRSALDSYHSRMGQILRMGQAACMVLAVVGTMTAYFLHRDNPNSDVPGNSRTIAHGTKASQSMRKARSGGTTPAFGNATPPTFGNITPPTFSGATPTYTNTALTFANSTPTFPGGDAATRMPQEGTVTMDLALRAAFPMSMTVHGYDVDNEGGINGRIGNGKTDRSSKLTAIRREPHSKKADSDHTTREQSAGYTPPPTSFPQTLAIPRGRFSYAAVQLASPPSPRGRRGRDVSVELESPIEIALPTAILGISRKNTGWDTTRDGRESLEAMYTDELDREEAEAEREMDAEKERGAARALLDHSSTTAEQARARRLSANSRRRSSGTMSTVHGHARKGSNGASRHRKNVTDDPSAYIRKRGSAPPASAGRKFFGWEVGSDEPKRGSEGAEGLEMQRQEASFIDLNGHAGRGRAIDAPKGKRQSLLSGIVSLGSSSGGNIEGTHALGRSTSLVQKLRRASKSRPRGEPAKSVPVPVSAASPTSSPTTPDSPSALAAYFGRLSHRALRSSASGAHRTEDEGQHTAGEERRAVQLKKSFRLGVGRTMGPGLTLSVVEQTEPEPEPELTPAMREKQQYYNAQREKEQGAAKQQEEVREICGNQQSTSREEGADVDASTEGEGEDGEVESIAAARLVSASIARATLAATMVTAPSTPLRSGFRMSYSSTYTGTQTQEVAAKGTRRPALANLAIVGGTLTPQSPLSSNSSGGRTPATRASWKPHPFADPVEEVEPISPFLAVSMQEEQVEQDGAEEDNDDELVQLEREMEEVNGRDNGKALHDFNATLTAGCATDTIPLAAEKEGTTVPGRAQVRQTLSSPPVPTSDWAPHASAAATATGGGFAYRFPMIFGASTSSSSRSGSPPAVTAQPYQQSLSGSTPGTPRSASNQRLPGRTMDTVRTVFSGVGARMSSATSRMSVTSAVGGPPRGALGQALSEMIAEDADGDFMDLRDPFAPPPPSTTALPLAVLKNVPVGTRRWDNFLVIDAYEPEVPEGVGKAVRTRRRRMSAWGRLPMPVRTLSPVPSSAGASIATVVVGGKKGVNKAANRLSRGKGGGRKTKKEKEKEKRTRKVTLPSGAGLAAKRSGNDDEDSFGMEEALLSQRLLRRLNSTEWELEWDEKV